jgi:hypothetical protein
MSHAEAIILMGQLESQGYIVEMRE